MKAIRIHAMDEDKQHCRWCGIEHHQMQAIEVLYIVCVADDMTGGVKPSRDMDVSMTANNMVGGVGPSIEVYDFVQPTT